MGFYCKLITAVFALQPRRLLLRIFLRRWWQELLGLQNLVFLAAILIWRRLLLYSHALGQEVRIRRILVRRQPGHIRVIPYYILLKDDWFLRIANTISWFLCVRNLAYTYVNFTIRPFRRLELLFWCFELSYAEQLLFLQDHRGLLIIYYEFFTLVVFHLMSKI